MKKRHKRRVIAVFGFFVGQWIFGSWMSLAIAGPMTGEQQLQLAEDLSARAIKRATEAKEVCDPKLIRESLELAQEAVYLTSSVAEQAEIAKDVALVQSAHEKGSMIAQALKAIGHACRTCCVRKKTVEGRTAYCCDCELVKEALKLARAVITLSAGGLTEAANSNNLELGRVAYATANAIGEAVTDFSGACACCSPGKEDDEGAGCCCDCQLPLETVTLAKDIAFVILEETSVAQKTKDMDLSRQAYRAALGVGEALWHVTESWMSWIYCTESRLGSRARLCFCDCGLVEETMALGENVESLVSKAVNLAEQEKDPDLVQEAYNMANAFDKGMTGVGQVATYCIRTSMDLAYVTCCRTGLETTDKMTERNREIIDKLITLGATPEGPVEKIEAEAPPPPILDEIPIRDHEQPPYSRVE